MAKKIQHQGEMDKEILWDTEEKRDLMSEKEGHIRDTLIYITAALWYEMMQAWGGVVAWVKTATDLDTSEVTLSKAVEGEPGAVAVRLLGAQNAAEFSFHRPLAKLGLKVPAKRQYNVTPFTRTAKGIGIVYVFPMAKRKSLPRNSKEEAAAAVPSVQLAASIQNEE